MFHDVSIFFIIFSGEWRSTFISLIFWRDFPSLKPWPQVIVEQGPSPDEVAAMEALAKRLSQRIDGKCQVI